MISSPEREYPCLLDRIMGPSARSSSSVGGMTPAEYRKAVLRDLKWLLNSPQYLRPDRCLTWGARQEATPHDRDDNLRSSENPQGYLYPFVRESVVNYGSRSLAGTLIKGSDPVELERDIREAIITFEPRLIAETVSVKISMDQFEVGTLAFNVSGQLWALPHPEPLHFRSEFDLESGGCAIKEKI
jgi:type VI secretion system protein ImpF